MSTLGLIYPNFWAQNFDNAGDDFHQCLIVIKVAYKPSQGWKRWGVGESSP
jgi:hypothetical protein